MTQRTFMMGLLLLTGTTVANAADKTNAGTSTPPAAAVSNATNVQVIAYYFHGTIRCETCVKVEKQAKAAIKRQFKTELADNRLGFKPLNYDLPENAHFLQDYKLPCPSLVLVRRQGGKDENWKLLGDTWDLVEDPEKFERYVVEEARKYLRKLEGAEAGSSDVP